MTFRPSVLGLRSAAIFFNSAYFRQFFSPIPTQAPRYILKRIGAVLLITVAVILYSVITKKEAPSYHLVQAKRGTVIQEVSMTGHVKPTESMNLAFDRSGVIASVKVKVGNKIKEGQILTVLQNNELTAQLNQAEAGVEIAQAQLKQYEAALEAEKAKLEELQKGTRPEEIKIAETNVANAKEALADAETNLANVKEKADTDISQLYDDVKDILQDAYVKADDAVNKQMNELFGGEKGDWDLTFLTSSQPKIDSEWGKMLADSDIELFKKEIDELADDPESLDNAFSKAEKYLNSFRRIFYR